MRVPLPPPKDMQALGAAITYARRYSIVSLLVLVAEEDDDAARPGAADPRAVGSAAPGDAPEAFSGEQLAELRRVMDDLKARDGLINWDDKARMFSRNKLNKPELQQMTRADMQVLIEHMREELANLG